MSYTYILFYIIHHEDKENIRLICNGQIQPDGEDMRSCRKLRDGAKIKEANAFSQLQRIMLKPAYSGCVMPKVP